VKTLADGVKVTDSALAQIVIRAAETVEGVRVKRPRRQLEIDVGGGEVRVVVDVTVEYGHVLPDAAQAVQRRVADALGTMCGLTVRSVDVNVEDVA
jgi:uncharacterized alkaline shock family protein YloU